MLVAAALLGGCVAAPFDPSSIAGLKLWLKADSLVLNDADPISTWTDSSGNGFNATASGTARPTYKTAIQNTQPVARFNGSTNGMNVAQIISAQPDTVIISAKAQTGTSGRMWDGISGSGEQLFQLNASGFLQMYAGSAFVVDAVDHYGAWHVFTAIFNGASTFSYLDGTQAATGNPGTNAGATANYLGWSGLTTFMTGDIGEVLVYDTALSSTNRGLVEAYLKSKWGTP